MLERFQKVTRNKVFFIFAQVDTMMVYTAGSAVHDESCKQRYRTAMNGFVP